MSYISNSRGEKVLCHRLLDIASQDDTIVVKSEEGKGFQVSRFLFNFFSNFILPCETDVVLTPLSSDHLNSVIQNLSYEGLSCNKDPFTDIVMDFDTIHRNKTLVPIRKQSEKEKECELQEKLKLSLSSTDAASCAAAENLNTRSNGMAKPLDINSESIEVSKGMAEPLDINSETIQVFKGMAEPLDINSETIQVFKDMAEPQDIKSETMQAVEAVDWPSNGKDAIEKKDLKISKQGKPTNHSIERIRKKVGAPLVGSKKGNPKIEWDSMDGEKYIKTITCQVCGKLFHHEKYVRGENLAVSYRNHY